MKKLLKFVFVPLATLALAFVAIAIFLPSEYRVERSIVIDAPRDRIHALVGDLQRWPEWMPWQDADPTIQIRRGGRTSGVGAHQSWIGDSGSGEVTFTASSPESGLEYDISFDDGAFRSVGIIQYQPDGNATLVTWVMAGDVGGDLLGRYFAVMMDSMVGPMFADGLEKLKQTAETKR